MNYFLAVISIPLILIIYYYLLKKPLWLLTCYIVAVPVLPPIPVGPIEISILDLLTIPALINLFYNFSRNGYKIKGGITIGLFIYVMVAVISFISFSIQNMTLSLPILFRIVRLIEMLLPVILASQIINTMKKEFPVIPFLIAGGITSIIAVFMFLNGVSMRESQMFTTQGDLLFRAAGTHGDSGSFGSIMGFSSLIALWVLIYFKELKHSLKIRFSLIITIVSALLTTLGLIVALSRGGFVLLCVGVIVLLFPLLKKPGRLFKIIVVAIIIILIAIPLADLFSDDSLITTGFDIFVKRISGLSEIADDTSRVTGGRIEHWQMGWEYFKSSPLAWFFGLGYKSLPLYYNILPDNNFNQALFEMGIFGALSLLLLLYFILMAGLKTMKLNSPFGIIILAIWLALISNMISADVLTYWHNIPAIFILLIVMSNNQISTESTITPESK